MIASTRKRDHMSLPVWGGLLIAAAAFLLIVTFFGPSQELQKSHIYLRGDRIVSEWQDITPIPPGFYIVLLITIGGWAYWSACLNRLTKDKLGTHEEQPAEKSPGLAVFWIPVLHIWWAFRWIRWLGRTTHTPTPDAMFGMREPKPTRGNAAGLILAAAFLMLDLGVYRGCRVIFGANPLGYFSVSPVVGNIIVALAVAAAVLTYAGQRKEKEPPNESRPQADEECKSGD